MPESDRGHFILLYLGDVAVHIFMEVVEGIPSGKKDCCCLCKDFSSGYASLNRQEEASDVLDHLRLEKYRTADGDDRATSTAMVSNI